MNTENTGSENALPEQGAPRKPGRTPPIVMTSTTNIARLQSNLKEHVKGEYEFRNTRNGTRIVTKEMEGYSAMISYLMKNNLQYFTFSLDSEKPIRPVIHHLPPDTPAKDISNNLEDLGFKVITTNGKSHVEPLPLLLVTLTRNIKSQELFQLNSLKHIIIRRELYGVQTDLRQCYNFQNVGHVWANCKQPPQCLWSDGCHLHY
jgi:hypothetical protein